MIQNTEAPPFDIFRHLASCYILPDNTLKDSLVALEETVNIGYPEFADKVREMSEAFETVDNIEKLQVEYTQLFIGPYSMMAPPYESIYQEGEGQMMGDSSLDVLNIYKEAGFELSESHKDAPDHISTELEFVYVLMARIKVFKVEGDNAAEEHHSALLKSLLINHLSRWIPKITHRIEEKTESDFYRSLAILTRLIILRETSSALIER